MPRVARSDRPQGTESPELNDAVVNTVLVEIPMSEPYASNFPIHVDLQLSKEVGMALRRIARAYDRQQATLANGRRIVDATTALRKVLEVIAESS